MHIFLLLWIEKKCKYGVWGKKNRFSERYLFPPQYADRHRNGKALSGVIYCLALGGWCVWEGNRTVVKKLGDTMAGGKWSFPWLSLGLVFLYELLIFILLLFLPVLEIWTDPTVEATKWVVLAAAILHFLMWGFLIWFSGTPARRSLTWHYGQGLFVWSFASIAAFWWDGNFVAPPTLDVSSDDATRAYLLWKVVLIISMIAAFISMASAGIYTRRKFKM